MNEKSVQEQYAPNSICFGCGPANEKGLQIKSYRIDNGLEMEFESFNDKLYFQATSKICSMN